MTPDVNNTDSFVDQVKEYINTRVSQLKISFAEKISKAAAFVIALVIVAQVFFLFVVLLSVSAAMAIGTWLQNPWLGFLIVGVLVLLIGLILWASKNRWLRKPIMNAMIEVMFDKDDEKD